MLRSLPPPFDARLIVLIDPRAATAQRGFASPALYAVRVVPARDTRAADWAAGQLRWCYVDELPALIGSLDLATGAAALPAPDTAQLDALRAQVATLEGKIATAAAALR